MKFVATELIAKTTLTSKSGLKNKGSLKPPLKVRHQFKERVIKILVPAKNFKMTK